MNAAGDNILETIRARKRDEVARQKEELPLARVERILRLQRRPALSLREALARSRSGVIAEFKRRSPSRGWIHPGADAALVTRAYEEAGAAAISCLTDEHFFGGGFADFENARAAVSRVPLLRKEFIVDEYQVHQSKVMGADAILLIAACLTREETRHFTRLAHALGMEVLLEIHDEDELDYIQPGTDVVGVNNRDLKTFTTDTARSSRLARAIPARHLKISESGLSRPETARALREEGFRGFLVGENFMKTGDPGAALRAFIEEVER
jgi:indole-3-glycerol phosphate synthase